MWRNSGSDRFIVEVSRSHTGTRTHTRTHTHIFRRNDQIVAETNSSDDAHAISWVRKIELLQTYTLDRTATGFDSIYVTVTKSRIDHISYAVDK
jgi:hypothetical protein